jgi:hypothetical protein
MGDHVELEEQDVAFEPKIAIAALRQRLPADEIARWDARLKRDLAVKGKPVAAAAKAKKEQPALTQPAH